MFLRVPQLHPQLFQLLVVHLDGVSERLELVAVVAHHVLDVLPQLLRIRFKPLRFMGQLPVLGCQLLVVRLLGQDLLSYPV